MSHAAHYAQFRVLFVYPNIQMRTIAPPGIALMGALLQEHGFPCEVFDCTRYRDLYVAPDRDYDTSHEKFVRMNTHSDRVANSNVAAFSWEERGIYLKSSDMGEDLTQTIERFDPRLVCFSIVENTYHLAADLMRLVPAGIPVVCGGVFCTYAPQVVIEHPRADFVCRGEGEHPLLELCVALAEGRDPSHIANFWCKRDGVVVRNGMRAAIDVDTLPFPDYGLFEPALLYTPMQGRVWKAVGFETQRGCPYTCTYCNSPSNNLLYSEQAAGRFYRKKSVERMKRELDHLIEHYEPELIYFVADTFLAMSRRELDEFSEFYQSYRIPFWMNTRAETITPHSAAHLARMNCLRFNIGIEHGNAEFRDRVLRRKVSNDVMLEAFGNAARYASEYTCVANSIIGLPTETEALAFDTIELNRQLPEEIVCAGAFIFAPFHGTALRRLAIQEGYVSEDLICTEASNTTPRTLLDMPQFRPEAIVSLMRTFSFYVKFPRDRWADIDSARASDPGGEAAFEQLRAEYAERYLAPASANAEKKLREIGWEERG